ncbi:MAG: hypothetical protein U0791_02900 [Gemmataceae bacterium]
MLNVVHICGDRMDNIYALLEPLDGGLEDHNGLAHWNGNKWEWIRRFENAYALQFDMRYVSGKVHIVDDRGTTLVVDATGKTDQLAKPAVEDLSGGQRNYWLTLFRGFDFIGPDQVGLVGDEGVFFVRDAGRWHLVETHTRANLGSILGTIPHCYITGDDGLVLRYDGKTCYRMHEREGDLLAHIDRGTDGSFFISFCRQDQKGGLLKLEDDTFQRIPCGLNLGSIAVVSAEEVYVCDGNGSGLYLWNRDKLELKLAGLYGAIAKIEGYFCFGTGPRPLNGDAIYYGPPFGPKISIDLDPEYLAQ